MEITVTKKGIIPRTYRITTKKGSLAIAGRDDGTAAGALIAHALINGVSVVIYSKNTDYYRYVKDLPIKYLYTLTSHRLMEEFKVPFIKETDSLEDIRDCFLDYNLDNKYRYLSSRKTGLQINDPNTYKSLITVKKPGTAKESVITEAFMTDILSSAINRDPLHEVLFIMDAPLRPVTETFLSLLEEASSFGIINIVLQYRDLNTGGEDYMLYSEGEKIFIKGDSKAFEVDYGEICKQE